MDESVTIENLELIIGAESDEAASKVDAFVQALKRLRKELKSVLEDVKGSNISIGEMFSGMSLPVSASRKPSRSSVQVADSFLSSKTEEARQVISGVAEKLKEIPEASDTARQSVEDFLSSHTKADLLEMKLMGVREQLSDALGEGSNVSADRLALLAEKAQKLQQELDKARLNPELSSEIKEAKKAVEDTGSALDKVKAKAKEAGEAAQKATSKSHSGISKFIASVKRIALYRIIRSMLSAVANSVKDGVKNLYQYSKERLGHFAEAMDSVSSSSLSLKNSIAAAAAPLIERLAPAVEWVTDKLIAFNNLIAKIGAALRGETTYTIATRFAKEYAEAAGEASKETKRWLLGIDELNIIGEGNNAGLSSAGVDYSEMFEEATMTSEEMLKIKETFETVWEIAKAIGITIFAWELSLGFISGLSLIESLPGLIKGFFKNNKIEVGLTLMIAGFALEAAGAYDIGLNGLDLKNGIKTALGAALGIAGSLLTFGTGPAGWIIGGLIAAVTIGVSIYLGEKEKIRKQYESSEGYKELQRIKADIQERWDIAKEINARIKLDWENLNDVDLQWQSYREYIGQAFDLSDIVDKTEAQRDKLKGMIDTINGWGFEGIALNYDPETGTIRELREDILGVVDALHQQALAEALHEMEVDHLKELYKAEQNYQNLVADRDEIQAAYDADSEKLRKLEKDYYDLGNALWSVNIFEQGGIETARSLWKEYNALGDEIAELKQSTKGYTDTLDNELNPAIADAETAVDNCKRSLEEVENELDNIYSASRRTAEELSKALQQGQYLDDWYHSQDRTFIPENSYSGMTANNKRTIGGVAIPEFADGGMPSNGQLFIAREAGAELVGNVGGRTAVMNNDQIVESVSRGVSDANAEQNALLREQNALLRQILAKETPSGSGYPSASEIINGLSRKNRRDGKTVVPVGV